jgi:hypothetical protein
MIEIIYFSGDSLLTGWVRNVIILNSPAYLRE